MSMDDHQVETPRPIIAGCRVQVTIGGGQGLYLGTIVEVDGEGPDLTAIVTLDDPQVAAQVTYGMIKEVLSWPGEEQTKVMTLVERVAELEVVLGDFVEGEDTPCRFDDNGFCQEHGWLAPGRCHVARGRQLLGLTYGAEHPVRQEDLGEA